MTLLIIITVFNTIAILYVMIKQSILTITCRRDETFWDKILMGYDIWIGKFYIRIPIRNAHKTRIQEDIKNMKKYSTANRHQTLHAKFSWLKNQKEVDQFQKDFSIADPEYVAYLVSTFQLVEVH